MAVIQDITQRVRVAEKLSNLASQLKTLNHMGQLVVSNRNTAYIFKEVLASIRQIVEAQDIFIFLEQNGQLVIKAQNEGEFIKLDWRGDACDRWYCRGSLAQPGKHSPLR